MPQGRPVLVQAGPSEQGREIAAAYADVVHAMQENIPSMRAYYLDLKQRLAKYGRAWEDLKVLPALRPIAGHTEAKAQAKFDLLQDLLDPLVGLARLHSAFGDPSGYPLDGRCPRTHWDRARPAASPINRATGSNARIRGSGSSTSRWRGVHPIGTASQIGGVMEGWADAGHAMASTLRPRICQAGVRISFIW
jgi:alkanesulfonate monooxygenase SsuD/methylene tetrahydromethanopterin reductase-like flavin-dependent oxidoreductase (luciferase family)